MHISDVLRNASEKQPSYVRHGRSSTSRKWSQADERRFFPPKTAQGLINLYERIGRMTSLGPSFIDITWGAGGSTSELTTSFVRTAHEDYGLETCMHLTCTNIVPSTVHAALREAKEAGCLNILALRGDPPRGEAKWTATEGGFEYAADLIKYIREAHGDTFCIGVAGFPEGHPEAEGEAARSLEMQHLKAKVEAGADFIVTQMFYDFDVFERWVKEVRAQGITIPILPGIMPIQGWQSFQKTTGFSKTIVPQSFYDALEPVKDDDEKVRQVGTELVAELCNRIMHSDLGIHSLHFYTMNLERGTSMLLEELKLVAQNDVVNPLPFRPVRDDAPDPLVEPPELLPGANGELGRVPERQSAWDGQKRLSRTQWGDSRSPAYGELDGYGVNLNLSPAEALKVWGEPKTIEEVGQLFARFCRGDLSRLPWSDQAPSKETFVIGEPLAKINEQGFLTINSQPAVDGADSSDSIYGWGPKHGYVYQKAYLEFFCSPDQLEKLVQRWENDPYVTWHAVSKSGELKTNAVSTAANAVTWGVFPNKEILQTTIVERVSFLAWMDEAFELGKRWGDIYAEGSPSRALIHGIFDSYMLVNVVRNDYRNSNSLAIFEPFGPVSTQVNGSTQASAQINGHTGSNWHTREGSSNGVAVKGVAAARRKSGSQGDMSRPQPIATA